MLLLGTFKTYHFDCRGSTIAITDASGNITDTFAYDTYGKLISRTGTSKIIFGYNGRDGVVTDNNGLIYMRARYYSPDMKRFINADIVAGEISNAVTLNRFAYANGNPISLVDPFGLSAERGGTSQQSSIYGPALPYTSQVINKTWQELGFKYDGSMRDFRRLEQGLPPYAYETWFKEAKEWLNENLRNEDGSYALYDNQRFDKDAVFHEQILAFTPSGPSFNPKEGNVGLGSLSVDVLTGGWEGEHANLSLLDFGHAEISAEMKDSQVSVGALASIWSPSFSVTFLGITIEVGAEIGAIGAGIDIGKKGFQAKGAYAFGASLNVSW